MPSTIVKLSSTDARAWAHNQPLWLDEGGEVVRPVTRDEQHAIGKALERTRRTSQSFRMDLALLPATPLNHRTHAAASMRRGTLAQPVRGQAVERINCAFEVTFVGAKRVVAVFHGKLRYATGREVLSARLIADHGECVLHGRNGKCIGVLRDPLIQERPPVTGRRVQWSRNPADAIEGERALASRDSSVKRRVTQTRGTSPQTYSPTQCPNDCRGLRDGMPWALAKGATPPTEDEHHPVCKFAPAWAATLSPVETAEVLYDLELSTVARAAQPNEIAEAASNEKLTGMRQVTVAGRIYAILPAAEARLAALEARGESEGEDAVDAAISTGADIDFTAPDPALEPRTEARSTAGGSSSSERDSWPELDPHGVIAQGERLRQRAEVTARDYLARPSPNPESSGA